MRTHGWNLANRASEIVIEERPVEAPRGGEWEVRSEKWEGRKVGK